MRIWEYIMDSEKIKAELADAKEICMKLRRLIFTAEQEAAK